MTDPTNCRNSDRDPLYRAIAAISLVLGVIGIWAGLIACVLGVW